jgi:hypothetical protein
MLNYFANAPLVDGKEYAFKVRAICEVSAGGEALRSAWTEERTCIPGAVTEAALGGLASRLPMRTMAKMVFASLKAVIRAKITKAAD